MRYKNNPSHLVSIQLFLIGLLSFYLSGSARGQADHSLLKTGDQAYLKQDFNKAEESYRKALDKKQNETTKYNLGNAIMEQNRPDEAITYYEDATKKSKLSDLNAQAFYNLGNAYYQKKEYDKSVHAYKQSLKQKPFDLDTKKNLSLAKKQLIKQQQQQQQQDQQNKDQQKQDQQNQDQQQQQQKDQQKQDQQKQDQKQQPQQQQPQQQQLSKEEAEQLLQYTEREDQRVQQKLVNKNNKKSPPKKDW